MAGAPTKLTPEVQEAIIRSLASGCYIETACAAAGIGLTTFYRWKQLGEAGRRPYVGFWKAVKEAEAQAEIRGIALVQKAAIDTWQAAAWYLERKYPDRWGRKDRVQTEVTGANGAPLQVVIRDFDAAETVSDQGCGDTNAADNGEPE